MPLDDGWLVVKWHSGREAELAFAYQEEQRMFRELLEWIVANPVGVGSVGVSLERVIKDQLEQDDVSFSSMARACGQSTEGAARLMREQLLDLLRRHGFQIVPNMNCEKLLRQYREIRPKTSMR